MLDTVREVETPEGIQLSLPIAGPVARARAWVLVVGCATLLAGGEAAAQRRSAAPGVRAHERGPLQGAWTAQRYLLAGGEEHEVRGRIFFTERDWQVLFFVMDGDGVARRGSSEGGRYTLEGDRLTFTHEFNVSGGEAIAGLPAADFSMTAPTSNASRANPSG